MTKTKVSTNIKRILTFTFSVFLILLFLFPIFFTISNSFMTGNQIKKYYDNNNVYQKNFPKYKLIPDKFSLQQYYYILFKYQPFIIMFWNSILLTLCIVIGQSVVSIFASYAFAKLNFPGRDLLFFIYMIVLLLPFQVTLVPVFIVVRKLNLLNTYAGIILPGIFHSMGIFLLRQFMHYVPDDIVNAAKMDGCNHFQILLFLVVPIIKHGIIALFLLLTVEYWNMVEQPLVLLSDQVLHPLSVYLARINELNKEIAFAASVLFMLPISLFFIYYKEQFIEGIEKMNVIEKRVKK